MVAGTPDIAACAEIMTVDFQQPKRPCCARSLALTLQNRAETKGFSPYICFFCFFAAGLAAADLPFSSTMTVSKGLSPKVSRLYPTALQRWQAGVVRPHDGREGLIAVGERTFAAVSRALRASQEEPTVRPLVVITHTNAALALTGRLLSLPEDAWLSIGPLAPGRWSLLETGFSGRWVICMHNIVVDPSREA
jgi:hypothetical protein